MLILTGNKAINYEQVFYFSVEKSRPLPQYLNASVKGEYSLIAYRSALVDEDGFTSDHLLIKRYNTQDKAVTDLNKITAAYEIGAACINLDTD